MTGSPAPGHSARGVQYVEAAGRFPLSRIFFGRKARYLRWLVERLGPDFICRLYIVGGRAYLR